MPPRHKTRRPYTPITELQVKPCLYSSREVYMIINNPNIHRGKPVIKGTRVTVGEILSALSRGWSINKIIKNAQLSGTNLLREEVIEAIRFAEAKLEEKG